MTWTETPELERMAYTAAGCCIGWVDRKTAEHADPHPDFREALKCLRQEAEIVRELIDKLNQLRDKHHADIMRPRPDPFTC